MRTSGTERRVTRPWRTTTRVSSGVRPSTPRIVNIPNRVGSAASATMRSRASLARREAPRFAFCLAMIRSVVVYQPLREPSLYIVQAIGYRKVHARNAAAHRMETFFSGQDLLFTLLMKLVVAASLAALLVRWAVFRKVLFAEVRDSDLK